MNNFRMQEVRAAVASLIARRSGCARARRRDGQVGVDTASSGRSARNPDGQGPLVRGGHAAEQRDFPVTEHRDLDAARVEAWRLQESRANRLLELLVTAQVAEDAVSWSTRAGPCIQLDFA